MFKKTKKLALKKESLRNLSEAELKQVNGGTELYYAVNYNWYYVNDYDWVIMRGPRSGTSKTESYNLSYGW